MRITVGDRTTPPLVEDGFRFRSKVLESQGGTKHPLCASNGTPRRHVRVAAPPPQAKVLKGNKLVKTMRLLKLAKLFRLLRAVAIMRRLEDELNLIGRG